MRSRSFRPCEAISTPKRSNWPELTQALASGVHSTVGEGDGSGVGGPATTAGAVATGEGEGEAPGEGLASGAGEAVSTNQTIGAAGTQKQIWIDLAYWQRPSSVLVFLLLPFSYNAESTQIFAQPF